jgi:xanthine dehydrogenase accessory factor
MISHKDRDSASRNIYTILLKELEDHAPVVIGTIIETKGSAPQISGASALFSGGKLLQGTLGGGLLEANAQKRSLEVQNRERPSLYTFTLTGDVTSEEEALCGGEAKILIDPQPKKHISVFQQMKQSLDRRRSGFLATFIGKGPGENLLISRIWRDVNDLDEDIKDIPLSIIRRELNGFQAEKKPKLLRTQEAIFPEKVSETLLFLEPVFPLPQLVIFGAGHIGKALCHLGKLLSFEVHVIDDRAEYANKGQLPDADNIIVDDIGKAMNAFSISSDVFIVIVTRGHVHDAEALKECIDSDAAYIGMIGSTRKIKSMNEMFLEKGWATQDQLDRVYAPIGIDIQSKTVEEIAVSIAAQLVFVRRERQDQREKRA